MHAPMRWSTGRTRQQQQQELWACLPPDLLRTRDYNCVYAWRQILDVLTLSLCGKWKASASFTLCIRVGINILYTYSVTLQRDGNFYWIFNWQLAHSLLRIKFDHRDNPLRDSRTVKAFFFRFGFCFRPFHTGGQWSLHRCFVLNFTFH